MPIFNVCAAAAWVEVRLNLIVVGLFVPRNCTDGKLLVELLPTVKVVGAQCVMRTSDGCMVAMRLPSMNSSGVPSQLPMRQIVAVVLGSPVTVIVLNVVGLPAVIVALPIQTASSPL